MSKELAFSIGVFTDLTDVHKNCNATAATAAQPKLAVLLPLLDELIFELKQVICHEKNPYVPVKD